MLKQEGFAVLRHCDSPEYELMFCVLNSPFVHTIFHPEFQGKGVLFQLEVENVNCEYERAHSSELPIVLHLVDEEVNGRHFTVIDLTAF